MRVKICLFFFVFSVDKLQINIRVLTIIMQNTNMAFVKLYLNDIFSFFNYTKYFFRDLRDFKLYEH